MRIPPVLLALFLGFSNCSNIVILPEPPLEEPRVRDHLKGQVGASLDSSPKLEFNDAIRNTPVEKGKTKTENWPLPGVVGAFSFLNRSEVSVRFISFLPVVGIKYQLVGNTVETSGMGDFFLSLQGNIGVGINMAPYYKPASAFPMMSGSFVGYGMGLSLGYQMTNDLIFFCGPTMYFYNSSQKIYRYDNSVSTTEDFSFSGERYSITAAVSWVYGHWKITGGPKLSTAHWTDFEKSTFLGGNVAASYLLP
jgi:hypothetical protein